MQNFIQQRSNKVAILNDKSDLQDFDAIQVLSARAQAEIFLGGRKTVLTAYLTFTSAEGSISPGLRGGMPPRKIL